MYPFALKKKKGKLKLIATLIVLHVTVLSAIIYHSAVTLSILGGKPMINNLPGSVLMLYNAESVNKKNTAGLRISEVFFFHGNNGQLQGNRR